MDLQKRLSSTSANPQKILKIVISVSVVLLVMWLFMVSRMEYSTSASSNPADKERIEGLRTSVEKPTSSESEPAGESQESPDIFMNAFTTFGVLIVLLGGVWLWTRKKSEKEVATKQGRELGGQVLGEGAQLKFVEVNDEIWILGVTSGSVNLLHRYCKDDWNEHKQAKELEEAPNSFRNIFGRAV